MGVVDEGGSNGEGSELAARQKAEGLGRLGRVSFEEGRPFPSDNEEKPALAWILGRAISRDGNKAK